MLGKLFRKTRKMIRIEIEFNKFNVNFLSESALTDVTI